MDVPCRNPTLGTEDFGELWWCLSVVHTAVVRLLLFCKG